MPDLLTLCSHTEPISFDQLEQDFAKLTQVKKIGEATFSEVFSVSTRRTRAAMKVLPFDGTLLVNGEKQQSLQDVYQEVNITRVLGRLLHESIGAELNFVKLLE